MPRSSLILVPTLLSCCVCSVITAADGPHNDGLPRVVAQVLIGTSGFEPGVAAEWRFGDYGMLVRPEVFINEDANAGGGASIGWELSFLPMMEGSCITLGPRVVYHNSDDKGWEADALAIWHCDLVPSQKGRHFLEVIGAIGVVETDKDGDNNHQTKVGGTIGIGYGFQF